MQQFLIGLVLFFGLHSISIVALPLRDKLNAMSAIVWQSAYGILSVVGIVLIARGYADLRLEPVILYVSPNWLRYFSAILLLPVFAFFFAPYFPGRIKTALKHPQLVAVKLWALAHLLVNGTLADVLLFGTFLIWAVVDRISMKKRESRSIPGAPESGVNDIILVVIGLGVYVGMVFWFHGFLFGVEPFV